jgi:two-component system phosphate regulon sensor histidine kinase PhoR
MNELDQLAALIERDRDVLLLEWRRQVRELPAAKHLDTPTLNDHIPKLIEELAAAFRAKSNETIPESLGEGSSPAHGLQRVRDGYDIEEVVAEYNILRGCIHDLADTNGINLQGQPFHILNRVFDGAIGLAVRTYASERARAVQQRREEYLAFVMHDLRTPLNAISLATDLLALTLSGHALGAKSDPVVKTLRRNVQHLAGLVAKIIDENSSPECEGSIKLERRAFDLWPLVESLIHDLHPVAGSASTLLINEVPDELVVYADAGLLRRVLQNLIANAIVYAPNGTVTVGAKELGDEGGVECWVSDNGAGIAPDRIDKVFEKHETDSQQEGSRGLGLAIVKTLVEAHEGTVRVESVLNHGAKFSFRLPGRQR